MKHLLYICTILIPISCENAQKQISLDKEQISKEIEQTLFDYHMDINKDGLTAEFLYLDNSSDFFWVPPGYTSALNYDSVRTILNQNAKSLSTVKFQWDTLQIFPLSDKIANYTGIVNGQTIDTAGVESNVLIIESGTLIKRDNGWKLLSGQSAILDAKTDNDSK
jgi:hypothetical protein